MKLKNRKMWKFRRQFKTGLATFSRRSTVLGTRVIHTLTTPIIEIAGDGKTAKGMCIWVAALAFLSNLSVALLCTDDANRRSLEKRDDIFDNVTQRNPIVLFGDEPDMRSHDNVRQGQKGMIARQRFLIVDIQTRPGYRASP